MLKRDQITDSCNEYIPKTDKKTFINTLNQISRIGGDNAIDTKLIIESTLYKNYTRQKRQLSYRKYIVIGLSILPVIFYKKLPILRNHSELGTRGFISAMMLVFPYLMNQKQLRKINREIEDRYFHQFGHDFRKFLITGDQGFLGYPTDKP